MSDAVKEAACRILLNMRQSNQRCLVKRQFDKVRETLRRAMRRVNRAQARVALSLGEGPASDAAYCELAQVFDPNLVEGGIPRLVVCRSHRLLQEGEACGLFWEQDGKVTFEACTPEQAKDRWTASSSPLGAMLCVRAAVDIKGEYHMFGHDDAGEPEFAGLSVKCPELSKIKSTHGDLFSSEVTVFGKREAQRALKVEYKGPFGLEFETFGNTDRPCSSGPMVFSGHSERTDFSQCVFLPREHLDKLDQLRL